jgi:hypothetical protein
MTTQQLRDLFTAFGGGFSIGCWLMFWLMVRRTREPGRN